MLPFFLCVVHFCCVLFAQSRVMLPTLLLLLLPPPDNIPTHPVREERLLCAVVYVCVCVDTFVRVSLVMGE